MNTEILNNTEIDFELKKLIETIDDIKTNIDIFSEIIEKQIKV